MKCAIIGLSEFGKVLALKLASRGAEVIAVDTNIALIEDVKNDVSLAVKLDATNERDLISQGINKVDVIVASMGRNFEINALVVVMAKKFGIPKIIARATNSIHARILRQIGATEVVQPEEKSAEQLSHRLLFTGLKSYLELMQGYSIVEIEISKKYEGKTLHQVIPRSKYKVNIIAVKGKRRLLGDVNHREDTINIVPQDSDELHDKDVITVAGADSDLARLLEDIGD